jgi:hypothetical protein
MSPDSFASVRELDERVSGGIQVRLLWSAFEDRAWVAVLDIQSGETFRVDVSSGESALDVFHHPFAYGAVRTGLPAGGAESSWPAEVTR